VTWNYTVKETGTKKTVSNSDGNKDTELVIHDTAIAAEKLPENMLRYISPNNMMTNNA
jgi:hypothetical protein